MTMIKPYKKCKKCGALIVSGKLCEDCKPMTNGDRIRQMTDEELALEIGRIGRGICNMVGNCENDLNCYKCRLQWLRKEADEDAGTDD